MTWSTIQSPALPLMPLKMLEEHPSLFKMSSSLHCSMQDRRACRHPRGYQDFAEQLELKRNRKACMGNGWKLHDARKYLFFLKLCVTYITHVSTSLWSAVFWLRFSRLGWKGKMLLKSKACTPNQPGIQAQACKARLALWMVKEYPSLNKSC